MAATAAMGDDFEAANFYIRALSCAGISIAAYSLYVKAKFSKDKTYRAMCDLGENVSCTRVLASKYGTNFGLDLGSTLAFSNSFLGILFYVLQFVLSEISVFIFVGGLYFCIYSSLLSLYCKAFTTMSS